MKVMPSMQLLIWARYHRNKNMKWMYYKKINLIEHIEYVLSLNFTYE